MERTPCIAYVYMYIDVIVFASTFRWNPGYCAYCVYDAYISSTYYVDDSTLFELCEMNSISLMQ